MRWCWREGPRPGIRFRCRREPGRRMECVCPRNKKRPEPSLSPRHVRRARRQREPSAGASQAGSPILTSNFQNCKKISVCWLSHPGYGIWLSPSVGIWTRAPRGGLTSACAAQVALDGAGAPKAVCGSHTAVDVTVTIVIPHASVTRNLTVQVFGVGQEEPARY